MIFDFPSMSATKCKEMDPDEVPDLVPWERSGREKNRSRVYNAGYEHLCQSMCLHASTVVLLGAALVVVGTSNPHDTLDSP